MTAFRRRPISLARRLATLARLIQPITKPLVLLTTVNAVLQRVVPREADRAQSFSAAPGHSVE